MAVGSSNNGTPPRSPAMSTNGTPLRSPNSKRSGSHRRWHLWWLIIPLAGLGQLAIQVVVRTQCGGDSGSGSYYNEVTTTILEGRPLRGDTTNRIEPNTDTKGDDDSPSGPRSFDEDENIDLRAVRGACQVEYDRMTADRLKGLTPEDLLRSQTFLGNRYRLAKLADKLQHTKKPLRVVLAGGSITLGHGVIASRKYSERLEDYFNEKFPVWRHPSSGKLVDPREEREAIKEYWQKRKQKIWRYENWRDCESRSRSESRDEDEDEDEDEDGDGDDEDDNEDSQDSNDDPDGQRQRRRRLEEDNEEGSESRDNDEEDNNNDDDNNLCNEDSDDEPELEGHRVINVGTHGADICSLAKRANQLIKQLGPNIDLFVLEFAVNDYQGQDHILMVEDRMDTFFDGFENIASCTESVLIKILSSYPDAAVVFLEMRTAVIPRKSGALLHMGAAQHYQVPVISYEQALFPAHLELLELTREHHYARPINDTLMEYPHGCHDCDVAGMDVDWECQSVCDFQRWSESWESLNCTQPPPGREPCYVPFLAHDEVHPSGTGHKIMTDLIVETLATTGRDLCRQQQQQQQEGSMQATTLLDTPAVLPRVGWMTPDPMLLDAQTNFLWVNDTYQMFHDQEELKPSSHTREFKLLEDRFDRWGWIAENPRGKQSITFPIQLPTTVVGDDGNTKERGCYIPYLSVLKSYENMGVMTVTVFDNLQNRTLHTLEIDGQWEPRISIPSDVQLLADKKPYDERDVGCSGDCTVTVTSQRKIKERTGNKIKIITMSVRPCLPQSIVDKFW